MGQTMVIIYMFACLLGTLTTFMVLSSYGSLVALMCAPLGGTALALVFALLVGWTERVPDYTPRTFSTQVR